MISKIQQSNSDVTIYPVTDHRFLLYGRILKQDDSAVEYLLTTEIPMEGNRYIADDLQFGSIYQNNNYYNSVIGKASLQYGYVNGHNQQLNSLEYHKSPEVCIAATPYILILGLSSDIKDNAYHTSMTELFYLPKGTSVVLHPGTLHFSPCAVSDKGFQCGVILPKGTNVDMATVKTPQTEEEKRYFMTNKWLLAHPTHQAMIDRGALIGLHGPNIKINY